MTGSIILGLLQNTAILLAFSMLYDNLWIKRGRRGNAFLKILTGLLIGGIGIILMLTPWTLVPGLVFDTRSVMLSISGLFFGFIPTITAIIVDVIYRLYIGGQGVWMGTATIISSGVIGIIWHYLRFGRIHQNKNLEFLFLGITVHVFMLSWSFLLPIDLALQTIKNITIPVIIVYIPATMLLGQLMINQYDNWLNKRIKEQLLESERRLNMDLVKAKEKAEESDRLKTAFLANLSHEIRTPLNGLLGFADILRQPTMTEVEMREYLGMVKISGIRMLEIMQNLIDISKLESGTATLHCSNIDVNRQIDNLYFTFLQEVTEKGLTLHCHKALPDKSAFLFSDEEKINTTINNLLKNAVKFSRKGKIDFGYIINEEGNFEYFVTDEGEGVPVEKQAVIFERFIQVHPGQPSMYEGTGLGLSIAKAFVEMMGGAIWINSVVGKGTDIRFVIPSKATVPPDVIRNTIS